MEKELEKYFDINESEIDLDLKILVESVFRHAYKIGQKNLIDNNPLADLWSSPEDDRWDEVYAKQLDKSRLTKINK